MNEHAAAAPSSPSSSANSAAICQKGRGDPRMKRALLYKLANPKATAVDALLVGGFEFPNLGQDGMTARTLLDIDNVTLSQRKNQLSRRVRLEKQRTQDTPPPQNSLREDRTIISTHLSSNKRPNIHLNQSNANIAIKNIDYADKGSRNFQAAELRGASTLVAPISSSESSSSPPRVPEDTDQKFNMHRTTIAGLVTENTEANQSNTSIAINNADISSSTYWTADLEGTSTLAPVSPSQVPDNTDQRSNIHCTSSSITSNPPACLTAMGTNDTFPGAVRKTNARPSLPPTGETNAIATPRQSSHVQTEKCGGSGSDDDDDFDIEKLAAVMGITWD